MFEAQQIYQSKIDITVGGSSISGFPVTFNIMSQNLSYEPVFWDTGTRDVALSGKKRSNIRGYDLYITLDYETSLEPDKIETILDGLVFAKNSNYVVRFYPDASDNTNSFVVIPSDGNSFFTNYEDTVQKGQIPTLSLENETILTQVSGDGTSPVDDDVDAETLDGLDSTQFLRSDVSDSFNGATLDLLADVYLREDVYGNGSNPISFQSNLDMNSNRIENVGVPQENSDVANKGYVDATINGLDWQESVISWQDSPPASPSEGDRYLVSSGQGDWSGQDDNVAIYEDGAWTFVSVDDATTLEIEDVGLIYIYNGTTWVRFGSAISHNQLQDLDASDHLLNGVDTGLSFYDSSADEFDTSSELTFDGTDFTAPNLNIGTTGHGFDSSGNVSANTVDVINNGVSQNWETTDGNNGIQLRGTGIGGGTNDRFSFLPLISGSPSFSNEFGWDIINSRWFFDSEVRLGSLDIGTTEHGFDSSGNVSGGTGSFSGNVTFGSEIRSVLGSEDTLINIRSNNDDTWLWRVSANGFNKSADFGFGLKYLGTGSGNDNDLTLYSDNQNGAQVEVYRVKQSGAFNFSQQTTWGSNAYLRANPTKTRFEVHDSVGDKIAMGYLDGLAKNDGTGNWDSNHYGFWVKAGDRLTIDGDMEYTDGDWLVEGDATIKIQDGVNGYNIINLGTVNGEKGLFYFDGTVDENIVAKFGFNEAIIAGWDINKDRIAGNKSTNYLYMGDINAGNDAWTSSVYGIQIGEDASNRIWMGLTEGYYDFTVRDNGNDVVTLGTRVGNTISGWDISDTTIAKNSVELSSSGYIRHTSDAWRFNGDGSGLVAYGNISWDNSGNVTLDPSVSISYSSVTGDKPKQKLLNAKINYISYGSPNVGEIYMHGFDSESNPADVNGAIWFNGDEVTVSKTVVYCGGGTFEGYLIWDSTESGKFTSNSASLNVVAGFNDGGQWKYDNNTGFTNFTPSDTDVIIGTVKVDGDNIVHAQVFDEAYPVNSYAGSFLRSTKITSTTIESPTLIGGTLQSSNWSSNTGNFSDGGTYFDLTNGNLYSEQFGIVGGSAYFKGTLSAPDGDIGGFDIGNNVLEADFTEGNVWVSSTQSATASTGFSVYMEAGEIPNGDAFSLARMGHIGEKDEKVISTSGDYGLQIGLGGDDATNTPYRDVMRVDSNGLYIGADSVFEGTIETGGVSMSDDGFIIDTSSSFWTGITWEHFSTDTFNGDITGFNSGIAGTGIDNGGLWINVSDGLLVTQLGTHIVRIMGADREVDFEADVNINGNLVMSAGNFSTSSGVTTIDNLPTSNPGVSGRLYTQTAFELGGSGSQKVVCVS